MAVEIEVEKQKYSSRMVRNGIAVDPVCDRTTCAGKVMSDSDISDTTTVPLRSYIALFPKVGSMRTNAWCRIMWRIS